MSLDGDTFAYCSNSRPRFDDEDEIRMRLESPPDGTTVLKVPLGPSHDSFVERGRDRNLCHALVLNEVSAPTNNW